MKTANVTAIHRYPVKSMGGERLETTRIGRNGLAGDRAWAVRDEVRGGIRGAKQLPLLLQCHARYEKPPAEAGSSAAEITLPDGTRISTGDAQAGARISHAIEHEVTLWPILPADAIDHYLRGAPSHDDMEQELRAVFAREAGEPLPDLGIFPPDVLKYESPPGTYFDAFPLMILSEQSLQRLQQAAPASRIDVRRFRPNLVVDAGDDAEPFPELAWRGQKLRIGSVVLDVTVECPRCVMTTHGFDDLPRDPRVMRALVASAGGNLGVYARVEEPGEIAIGDAVTAL